MNSRASKRKKKKDRTWAEAAVLALQMSPNKMLSIRQILQAIHQQRLKEISMNKAAENVLTTMLNHHAQLPNCSFFRVKSRLGLYALKKSYLKKNGESIHGKTDGTDVCEDEDDVSLSALLTPSPCDNRLTGLTNEVGRENHAYSIQGRALRPDQNNRKPVKPFSNSAFRKKNSSLSQGVAASVGSSRRHSSPLVFPYQSTRSAATSRHHHHTVTRANSFTTRHSSTVSQPPQNSPKNTSTLDLETPSSILVNANMRALVNRETFSMLPSSYRYMLTKLLPGCDQVLADVNEGEQKVLVPSQTALTNEFFTQAVQEWRERLADGEFTQETQSRIVQEIAKERSKIDPWKEKFFEEYYGQKQVPKKRLRSRSQNLAAETGHKMRDLGMEAQLHLFAHLRPELQDNQDSESRSSDADLQISDEGDDEFFEPASPRRLAPSNNLHLRTLAVANSFKKISYAERVAKNKLLNSRLTSLRTKKASTTSLQTLECSKEIISKKLTESSPVTSAAIESAIVLKPSWSVSAFSRCVKNNRLQTNAPPPPPPATDENTPDKDNGTKAILNVQKRSDNVSTAMADHSYTSALWLQNSTNSSTNNNHAAKSITSSTSRSSSTLVLCPSGNLTHFTIANMNSAKLLGGVKKEVNVPSSASDPTKSSILRGKIETSGSASLKPAAHLLSSGVPTNPSDTERVLSLCARPLTPESFVPGSVKPAGVISVKQVQSPLLLGTQAEAASTASSNKIKNQIKQEMKQKDDRDVTETKAPLLQPSKIKGIIFPVVTTSPTTTSASAVPSSCTIPAVSKPTSKESLVSGGSANTFLSPSLTSAVTISSTVSTVSCLSNATVTVPSVALSAYSNVPGLTSALIQNKPEIMCPSSFSHPLQGTSSQLPMVPTVSSPLIAGRLSLAGKKRSLPPPPATVSTESPSARWSGSSGSSPSPIKKTRTLAEIKAQMKAKRAAAVSIKPVPPHQPGVVAPNSRTHLFSATTFPVYFPMVTDANVNNSINHSQNSLHPNTAAYIRLPTTATLPLEKVQWVSHQVAPNVQATLPSNQLFNHTTVTAALRSPPPIEQHPVAPASSSMSSTKQAQPPVQTTKSEGKGKITLKIKAAGSAISLKVDADVIKKELKRSAQCASSDDDLSSDDSNSDESDVDRSRISKHRGPIKLPKLARRSSDSGSDLEKSTERRWAPNAIDTCQQIKKPNTPLLTTRQTPVTSPILLSKPPPVFGVSPFNVSVKPATTIMDPSVNHFTKNNLFHHKPPLSFSSVPVSISWATNKVMSNTSSTSVKPSDPPPASLYQSSKYRSTSKGKSLQNMQELARTNRIHSDDSAEDDEDSSGDEDPCDSTFSTTTASENEKCSESDEDPVPWTDVKSSAGQPMTTNDKRTTRSSNIEKKLKKTGV